VNWPLTTDHRPAGWVPSAGSLCPSSCVVVPSDELMHEAAALNEAVADSAADIDAGTERTEKQRSVSPTVVTVTASPVVTPSDINVHSAVSFDAQPVNFYIRIGAIGSSLSTFIQ